MAEIAARYLRVSGISQEDNTSLEKQEEDIDRYCQQHGYLTPPEYLYTEIFTGVDTLWDRVMLQRMLDAVRNGEIDVVVAHHPDRAARGEDLIVLIQQLLYYGARLETVQQKIEDTPEGNLITYISSWGSKQEWRRIVKRTTDGRQDYVKKRHHLLGSSTSLGYKWNDDHTSYVINDDVFYTDATGKKWTERMVVEFCFAQAKAGVTIRQIAKKLTDLGMPTRHGNSHWYGSTISRILRNPVYIGKYYGFREQFKLNGTRTNKEGKIVPNYKRTVKPLAEQYLLEGLIDPIIDEDTFIAVQEQLSYNQKTSRRNNVNYERGLVRLLVYCAHCGGKMHCSSESHEHIVYQCQRGESRSGKCEKFNSIGTMRVDTDVWKLCCEIIRNPKKLEEHIEALRTPDPTEKPRVPIAVRKKEIEAEIDATLDLLHDAKTEMAKQKIKTLLKISEDELQVLEEREKILSGQRDIWAEAQKEIDKFESWCHAFVEKLETADYKDKRYAVEMLGITVKVWRYGFRPRIKISVSPPKIMEKLRVVSKHF